MSEPVISNRSDYIEIINLELERLHGWLEHPELGDWAQAQIAQLHVALAPTYMYIPSSNGV